MVYNARRTYTASVDDVELFGSDEHHASVICQVVEFTVVQLLVLFHHLPEHAHRLLAENEAV